MEIWKPIKGLEDVYEVSNLGQVRSLPRETVYKNGTVAFHKGQVLKQSLSKKGYLKVYPTREGKKYNFQVHRLVAKAFIPNPKNKPQVNHKDGNKLNNHVDNLEWVTNDENEIHANENGLRSDYHQPKQVAQYTLDGKLVAIHRSVYQSALAVDGDNHKISLVCRGLRHTHKGFVWKFV